MNRANKRAREGPLTFRKVTERLRSCYYGSYQHASCKNSEGKKGGRQGREDEGAGATSADRTEWGRTIIGWISIFRRPILF
jgi:hypothetical protein